MDHGDFVAIYDAYADRIFGFCVTLVRDRDEAADATQEVFVAALQHLGQLRERERLCAWLFAIARHECFRRLRRRGRVEPVPLDDDMLVDDDQVDVTTGDAAALVWAAAAGLNERDRAVLSLNTQGLEGAELAAALGVDHANPYSMLHRAKTQLERAVGALLVARLGRRDCADLDAILHGWDDTLTPLLRKRLARHVERCATCHATHARARRLPALAAASLFEAARAEAWPRPAPADILDIAARRPAPAARWRADGFPPADRRRRRRWRLAALGLAVLLLAWGTGEIAVARTHSGHPQPARGTSTPAHHAGSAHHSARSTVSSSPAAAPADGPAAEPGAAAPAITTPAPRPGPTVAAIAATD
ncbi:MAG TPA: sigma-70 family RNA polymerase sigma factor, partial [Acidimicrobiia bacterium]|nr:sigma-70 family RNA polymerase sigma factor [Acidimicrobiia bacterium]